MEQLQIAEKEDRVIIDRVAGEVTDRDLRFTLARGSRLVYCFALFGGQVRRRLTVHLHDEAELRVVGFFIGQQEDRFQLAVAVHHDGRATKGLTNLRGALAGSATADASGLIAIPPSGVQTTAFFEARTMLLSRTAKSESLPSLEILANDVKAGHASTTSGLDPENLFYLESRGLPKASAARMLIEGLLAEPLRDLPDAERVSLLGHLQSAVRDLPLEYV